MFLVHRELAGGQKGASLLKASDPFDSIVVTKAHELLRRLEKRDKKDGEYDEGSRHAQTAGRVREVVKRGNSPVLLLTATPMQNSLAELWGLVHTSNRPARRWGLALDVPRGLLRGWRPVSIAGAI